MRNVLYRIQSNLLKRLVIQKTGSPVIRASVDKGGREGEKEIILLWQYSIYFQLCSDWASE